jgi:UDP-N-acetylglucosamine 2-epimerase (non-hydrolysing)
MIKMLFIFGTRPEAIKLAPLIKECQKRDTEFKVLICVTAQHRGMLDQVLDFFAITPDFDLDIMKKNQRLSDLTSQCLLGLDGVLTAASPDLIIVQGDTTTAFVGALCGYYHAIKVAHVEAGLRSLNKYSPFPEEMNRVLAGRLADYHFAPTETAAQNLRAEGITKDVWTVGNTVIDALFLGLEMIRYRGAEEFVKHFSFLDFSKRIILVTCHRRESFGAPLERLCMAFKTIAAQNPDIQIVFPVHLNPRVQEPAMRILKDCPNIHLIEPLDYPHFIWLMDRCFITLTDSGGVQEEAPSLGKPVLVMREVTERTEGVEAGTAKLVGTNPLVILRETNALLRDATTYQSMSHANNPYGDGASSAKIADILLILKK